MRVITLRNLVMDSPMFAQLDPYYAEFTLRAGTDLLVSAITSLLAPAGIEVGHKLQLDKDLPVGSLSKMVELPGPTEGVGGVLLHDTALSIPLFISDGRPNAVFMMAYNLACTVSVLEFEAGFTNLMRGSEFVQWLGVTLLEYPSITSEDSINALTAALTAHVQASKPNYGYLRQPVPAEPPRPLQARTDQPSRDLN